MSYVGYSEGSEKHSFVGMWGGGVGVGVGGWGGWGGGGGGGWGWGCMVDRA